MAQDATDDPLTGKSGPAKPASRRNPPIIEGAATEVAAPAAATPDDAPPPVPEAGAGEPRPDAAINEPSPTVPPDTPAPEPGPDAPAPQVEPARSGGFNAAIAIPVGLALMAAGAGAVWYLKSGDPALGEAQSRIAALNARIDALEGKLATPPAAVAALDKRLAAMEAAVKSATSASDAARAAADAARGEARKALEAPKAASGSAAPLPAVDLAPLDTRLADLEKRLPGLEAAVAAPKADARVLAERESRPSGAAAAASRAVVADTLTRTIERGAPFAAELAALRGLGAPEDKLKALEPQAAKGVASLAVLSDMFRAASPAALAAVAPKPEPAPPAAPETGLWDMAASRVAGFVRIRKVGEPAPAGASLNPAAVEAALARGDVEAALAAFGKWPDAARAPLQAWANAARQRAEAIAAARALLADAIAALGKPQ